MRRVVIADPREDVRRHLAEVDEGLVVEARCNSTDELHGPISRWTPKSGLLKRAHSIRTSLGSSLIVGVGAILLGLGAGSDCQL